MLGRRSRDMPQADIEHSICKHVLPVVKQFLVDSVHIQCSNACSIGGLLHACRMLVCTRHRSHQPLQELVSSVQIVVHLVSGKVLHFLGKGQMRAHHVSGMPVCLVSTFPVICHRACFYCFAGTQPLPCRGDGVMATQAILCCI